MEYPDLPSNGGPWNVFVFVLSDSLGVPEIASFGRTPALTDFWGTSEDAGILRALCTQ